MDSPGPTPNAPRRGLGFTLVEVLVVVVLVGLLSTIAGVYWGKFTAKMKVSGAAKELRGAILTARSDALTRKRYSGIVIDFSQRKYLRFIDSSGNASTSQNCRNEVGEKILQDWTELSSKMVFHSQASSISPVPGIRDCEVVSTGSTGAVQTGAYSVVFRPDGSSCATLMVRMGVEGVPSDTVKLSVLPATGLVAMGR